MQLSSTDVFTSCGASDIFIGEQANIFNTERWWGATAAMRALALGIKYFSRLGKLSRSLPSLVRPLRTVSTLSRSLPSLAEAGGRPASSLRRMPTFHNLHTGMNAPPPSRSSSLSLRTPPHVLEAGRSAQAARAGRLMQFTPPIPPPRSTSLPPVPPPRSTSLQFSGFSTPHSSSHFLGFSTPHSASQFSGFSMPRSEFYGSMPRLATPGSSVRLASGESLSHMPTLSRAGSGFSMP